MCVCVCVCVSVCVFNVFCSLGGLTRVGIARIFIVPTLVRVASGRRSGTDPWAALITRSAEPL